MFASEVIAPAGTLDGAGTRRLTFEFRGGGLEFFRIWIINISLTLITLGIYSAWARVRTKRYFYGNTYLDGHSFDYHASPWRILIGRAIAVALFIAYNITASINPFAVFAWFGVFVLALPWLINSSFRFNARNTSYRNVRFNFRGDYGGAFAAHVAWWIAAYVTVGILLPLSRRARDYYQINNHTYGGKPFRTDYTPGQIYFAYLWGILFGVAVITALFYAGSYVATLWPVAPVQGKSAPLPNPDDPASAIWVFFALAYGTLFFIGLIWYAVSNFIDTLVFNLAVRNSRLDERHKMEAALSPFTVVWIKFSNMILTMLTLGLLYPWAKVRLARYQANRVALLAASDLSEFTSEFVGVQSAVGEEIGSFFDVDLGL